MSTPTLTTPPVSTKTGVTLEVAKLAGPLILLNMSQTLLGVADTYFVSRLSTDAVAAVGLASVIYFAVFTFFRSIANSTIVFVGRAHGENDAPKVGTAVWRSLNMIGVMSLATIFLPWIFTFIVGIASPADNPTVRELGTIYTRIRAVEMPLIMFSGVVWGFLVGRGDSRTPMILAWITVLTNIFLDWVLVLGNLGAPMLGVAGASYATVLANLLNVVLSSAILWNRKNRQMYGTGKAQWLGWAEIKRAFNIGLPMGLGDFLEIASFSAFFALIARLGTEILAANQIALQYMSLSFTFGMAVGMASSSLVSKYLGAKQPDIAEKVGYRAMWLAMAGMAVIGMSYLIAPEQLMGFFTEDTAVISAGVTILRLVALYQTVDGLGIAMAYALYGAGDTKFAMYVKAGLAWGFFIPLVWIIIFPLNGGIGGAWAGALVYLASLGVVYLWRFRSGVWKSIELD